MKLNALKSATLVALTMAVSACSTTDINTVADWQSKVWRGQVQRQFLDSSGKEYLSDAVIQKTHYSYEHVKNMRYARVQMLDGQTLRVSNALVPDSIEFDDIQKGAIVDYIVEPGPMVDFSMDRVNRILKLVCRAKDTACIDREKAEKRFNTVIDANPGNTFKTYGETFVRRNTPADIAKYK